MCYFNSGHLNKTIIKYPEESWNRSAHMQERQKINKIKTLEIIKENKTDLLH